MSGYGWRRRLSEEAVLFWRRKWEVLLGLFLLVYIGGGVARNLSTMRNEKTQGLAPADNRLPDVGFDVIPELPGDLKWLSEVAMISIHIMGGIIILLPCLYENPVRRELHRENVQLEDLEGGTLPSAIEHHCRREHINASFDDNVEQGEKSAELIRSTPHGSETDTVSTDSAPLPSRANSGNRRSSANGAPENRKLELASILSTWYWCNLVSAYDWRLARMSPRAYTVNIGLRVLLVLALGHTLRWIFYLSTSLPSPATHCQTDDPGYEEPPEGVIGALFSYAGFWSENTTSCGDLIFSGHVFQNLIFTLTAYKYGPNVFGNKLLAYIYVGTMVVLNVAQWPLVIAARNHYTVDVVVAIYVAPTLWFIYNYLRPDDPEPMMDRDNISLPE